jgi:predicted transposase YdaD
MRESTMYQFILREGRAEGLEQGLIQGRTVGQKVLLLKLLARKLGSLPLDVTTKVNALRLEGLEALSDAIFDFTSVEDLESWLG